MSHSAVSLWTKVYIVGLALLLQVALKTAPLPSILKMLDWLGTWKIRRLDQIRPVDLANLTLTASRRYRFLGVGECLIRSLSLYHLLLLGMRHPVFLVGVKIENGEPAMHSWIEIDNAPLGEKIDPKTTFRIALEHNKAG